MNVFVGSLTGYGMPVLHRLFVHDKPGLTSASRRTLREIVGCERARRVPSRQPHWPAAPKLPLRGGCHFACGADSLFEVERPSWRTCSLVSVAFRLASWCTVPRSPKHHCCFRGSHGTHRLCRLAAQCSGLYRG